MSINVTCPECQTRLRLSENVTARPFVCPRCFGEIEGPSGAHGAAPNLLRDVRRDGGATRWILWLLIGLCVLGIVLCYGAAHERNTGTAIGALLLMAACFGVLDILVFVASIVPIWRAMLSGPSGAGVARSLGLAALTIGLGMAILVFFGTVCGVMLSGM